MADNLIKSDQQLFSLSNSPHRINVEKADERLREMIATGATSRIRDARTWLMDEAPDVVIRNDGHVSDLPHQIPYLSSIRCDRTSSGPSYRVSSLDRALVKRVCRKVEDAVSARETSRIQAQLTEMLSSADTVAQGIGFMLPGDSQDRIIITFDHPLVSHWQLPHFTCVRPDESSAYVWTGGELRGLPESLAQQSCARLNELAERSSRQRRERS